MLSKRLSCVASFIPDKLNVYDIGCDHALLDIFLTNNNNNTCVAADISENVIKNANKNISKYDLTDKIQTIVSDGVKNIEIKNNSVIVISGMGTHTIIDIVKQINNIKINRLIIQSNNEIYLLRKEITKLGYIIDKEKIVYDNKKYYTIILFIPGFKKYSNRQLLYGINVVNDDEYKQYLKYLIDKNKIIYERLNIKHLYKKITLLNENNLLKKKLK